MERLLYLEVWGVDIDAVILVPGYNSNYNRDRGGGGGGDDNNNNSKNDKSNPISSNNRMYSSSMAITMI